MATKPTIIAFPRNCDEQGLIQRVLDAAERLAEASRVLDEALLALPREVRNVKVGTIEAEDNVDVSASELCDLCCDAESSLRSALEPTIKAIVKRKMNR